MDLKNYSGKILAALLLSLLACLLELTFGGQNPGLIMGALKVSLEIYALYQINRILREKASDSKTRFLTLFFAFLCLGDFFYVLLYYGLHLSSRTMFSATLTTVMYSVGYFSGAAALTLRTDHPVRWMRQKLLCASRPRTHHDPQLPKPGLDKLRTRHRGSGDLGLGAASGADRDDLTTPA